MRPDSSSQSEITPPEPTSGQLQNRYEIPSGSSMRRPRWTFILGVVLNTMFFVVIPGVTASLQLQGVISTEVAAYALALTWISAMCGLGCMISIWPYSTRKQKILVGVLGGASLALLFLGVNVGARRYLRNQQTTSITCQLDGLPTHFPGTSPNAMLIDPYFSRGFTTGWLINSAGGLPPDFEPKGRAKFIYQCELTNGSTVPIPDIHLRAKLNLTRSHNGIDSVYCDGLDVTGTKDLDIEFGDLAGGAKFWFYFYNGTPDCAGISFWGPFSSGHPLRMFNKTTDPYISLGPSVRP